MTPPGDGPRRRKAAPRRPGSAKRRPPRAGSRAPRHQRPTHGPVDSGFSPMTALLLVVALGLAVVMGMILMPKDLDQIQGYPVELSTDEPRNLLKEMQVVLDPKSDKNELAFTEAEVNRYLSERIGGKQGGPLGALVKYKGVYVDLDAEFVELYLVRSVAGLPFTVSCRLTQKDSGYVTMWKAGGGTIGRFRMGSKQFKPILGAFIRLRQVCSDEMKAIDHMRVVKFENDKIVFVK